MLLELFVVFFKLGAFTIGGGIAMLPLLQHSMIDEKKWFTKEEFVDMIAVCQSMPGVVAINMATYVGYKKKGFWGSLVATIGVILPSFVIILIVAKGLMAIGDNHIVNGAMAGLRAAALGLVLVSFVQMANQVFKDKLTVIAGAISFILIAVIKIDTVYVIFGFLFIGVLSELISRKRNIIESAKISESDSESTDNAGGDDK